ncbi:O-antigen polymerase [Massilia sp. PWRC2]|uniref:O-antigen polymerase n=1 Tax=Massilia sp. PWRC2 TaxID=2804626 RepID=UPI003CFA637F
MSAKAIFIIAARFLPLVWVLYILTMTIDVHLLTKISLVIISLLFVVYRFDLTNVWVAFSMPWFIMLIFGTLGISEYSRDVDSRTVTTIVALLLVAAAIIPSKPVPTVGKAVPIESVRRSHFIALFIVFISLAILNVAVAGYVPLISLLTTGDSGYMNFGVKGVYGFFNAFSNALGVTAFYLWMTVGGRLYRNVFFIILLIFTFFVTRQNILSLLIEAFVVYNLLRVRVKMIKVVVIVGIVLFLFGVLGDLRVGKDISEVAKIEASYQWLPTAAIWLYSYFYFNLLNLDNIIAASTGPLFDLSSFAQLIPSFLRPIPVEGEDLLEVSSFTVGTFILPIYRDIGLVGLITIFSLMCFVAVAYRRMLVGDRNFVAITSYAVLHFCFMFSFFENFFFYLPVIFQLFFLFVFRPILFPKLKNKNSDVQ